MKADVSDGCWLLAACWWMLAAAVYWLFALGCWVLDVDCCCCLSLAGDCSLLVAGCWLLDVCCWLVAGCYLPADTGWDSAVETGRRSVGRREQEIGGGGIMFGVIGVCDWGGGVFAGCCRWNCPTVEGRRWVVDVLAVGCWPLATGCWSLAAGC